MQTEIADGGTDIPIKKCYPTVEECRVNNMVKCTEEGCQSVFTSESNLNLHLAKTHKLSHLLKSERVLKQYHCPEKGCLYNAEKFFKSIKFLRQHYLRLHAAKDHCCKGCQKVFPSEYQLKYHTEYCGVTFMCGDCSVSYPCYETLKTHGRRKKHQILPKCEYKLTTSVSETKLSATKQIPILPKSLSLIVLFDSTKTFNQESQTIDNKPKLKSKMTQVSRDIKASQNSQQTQTDSRYIQLTVETQTIGDFVQSDGKEIESIIDAIPLKNSKTQTEIIESRSTSCNTSFGIEDFENSMRTETASFGTQTQNESSIYSTSTTTHDTTHTDTSDLLVESIDNMNNFEFDNCHMETQTDFMFEEGMFDCDYMSNMYTQTCCDDVMLNDFGLNDIETQTVFADMLRSVESQTMMSHSKKNVTSCRDMAHIETQTDVQFRQMLEVINS